MNQGKATRNRTPREQDRTDNVVNPVRVIRYAPDGSVVDERVIAAADLAGHPEQRRIPPHIPKAGTRQPTAPPARERGRQWAHNSFA